jgi:hypothetical protein
MFVITATFDEELALGRIRDMLALAETPEILAERLNIERDVELVHKAVITPSFKRLSNDVKAQKQYVAIGKQIDEVKTGGLVRLFGSKEKKIARLEEERGKLPPLLATKRWFYAHPRVNLLSTIRDHALDSALHADAAWREVDPSILPFPIAAMFAEGDFEFAKTLTVELEKPLKQIDPQFLLTKFEGHRSIGFDLETHMATYYVPAPTETAETH